MKKLKINTFEIEGFWGRATVKGKMYSDVTIFIGDNGTGKTTLINILVAALRVDTETLESIPFETIKIGLKSTTGKKEGSSIEITRIVKDVPYTIFKYKMRNRSFRIFSEPRRRRALRSRRVFWESPGARIRYENLKELLDKYVEISWISVYRSPSVAARDDEGRRFNIDRRLEELTTRLSKYQLRLENQIRDRSQQFQKDVLQSLLYSKELDDLSDFQNIRKKIKLEAKQENALLQAFRELGIVGKEDRIKKHYEEIRKAIKNISTVFKGKKKELTLSDISPLPFATRTQTILQLMEESEKDKELIRKPIEIFLETLHSFINKKRFEIEAETGELVVKLIKEPKEEALELFELSSGEKQLLIQLLEILLQEKRSMIFFADEPELSLHVEWQEKLLPALRKLNKNSQIIVATHSPDIVSEFRKNVINMEDIVKDGV